MIAIVWSSLDQHTAQPLLALPQISPVLIFTVLIIPVLLITANFSAKLVHLLLALPLLSLVLLITAKLHL